MQAVEELALVSSPPPKWGSSPWDLVPWGFSPDFQTLEAVGSGLLRAAFNEAFLC